MVAVAGPVGAGTARTVARQTGDPAFQPSTRLATALSLSAVAGAVLVSLVLPGWSGLDGWVLAAGLLVGLPHGAVDHLLPAYRGHGLRVLPLVLLGYVAVAAAAWALLVSVPGWGLAAFIALSVLHFGAGERTFTLVREPGSPARVPGILIGATVVGVPLLLHGSEVAPYLADLVPGWDGRLPASVVPVAASLLLVDVIAAGLLLRSGRRLVGAEVGAVAVLTAVAPAAVAIGVYFGAWHSVRHLALLVAEDPQNRHDLLEGRLGRPARRLAVSAALPTFAALGFVLGLWAWSADRDVHRFVTVDISVLAALTVPHALAVAWLDRTRPARQPSPSQDTMMR